MHMWATVPHPTALCLRRHGRVSDGEVYEWLAIACGTDARGSEGANGEACWRMYLLSQQQKRTRIRQPLRAALNSKE